MSIKIHKDFDVKDCNTLKIPCKVSYFLEPQNEDEIELLLKDEFFNSADKLIMGGGSNLLFTSNYKGVVVRYKGDDISIDENAASDYVEVTLGAGLIWDDFVKLACEKGWWGVENLSYIPGHCGAAAVQNIGAYGAEIKDVIVSVTGYNLLTKQKETLSKDECKYSYRYSIFKSPDLNDNFIITSVKVKLRKHATPNLTYKGLNDLESYQGTLTPLIIRDRVISIRKQKLPDPDKLPNAGSFFMNPTITIDEFERVNRLFPDIVHYNLPNGKVKLSAAWLIDKAGFKGLRKGEVGCYKNHALIVVNYGNATGREVVLFASEIQERIKSLFGIQLRPEVKYVNASFMNE